MLKLKSEETIISAVELLCRTALVAAFGIELVKWHHKPWPDLPSNPFRCDKAIALSLWSWR
jgi:hypothetical protein